MVQQDAESILKDTERTTGRSALRNNVAAAIALAGAVRSTLGPKGLDKLLVDSDGSTIVTNDGVTVLESALVEHPTAKMLISASTAQDEEAKDGTTTTVLLIAELLVNALELIDRGVHPTIVANGYRMCVPFTEQALESIAVKADAKARMEATMTALAGKGDEALRARLSELAVQASEGIVRARDNGEIVCDSRFVKIVTDRAGVINDSHLVNGLVLAKQRVHREMPKTLDGGTILILDGGIERRKPSIDATLRITNTGALEQFHAREREALREQVDALKQAGVDLLIVRDGIEDEAHQMLADAGIVAYRRVERDEFELVARATGARPVGSVERIRQQDLGTFASLREEKWHGTEQMILEGSLTQGLTLVLRGSTDTRLEEAARCAHDALGVACQLMEDASILPGGGATHVALSRRLRRHAETIPGREQMAIEAFAASLEAIPRILAENAGLNPIDQLLSINAAQAAADDDWIGLDIHTSEICNMADAGIVEPLRITRHAIGGATESAISVLRIDDVLWAKQDAQEPDWQNDEV